MLLGTYNVNGIRAATRRGFRPWIEMRQPDVLCLQEVRCPVDTLPASFAGYHVAYDSGTLAGRNGVAIVTRVPVESIRTWGGEPVTMTPDQMISSEIPVSTDHALVEPLEEFAHEGRYIEADLADHPVTVACVYIPKGDSPYSTRTPDTAKAQASLDRKMRFLDSFDRYIRHAVDNAADRGREFVVVGDFNIAHENCDLKNWRSNHKTSGFLPQERDWLSAFLEHQPLCDVIRLAHPDQDGPYSWWSWRGQAFTNNAGWRIDYQMCTDTLAKAATRTFTDRDPRYDARVSDHCPVLVDYTL